MALPVDGKYLLRQSSRPAILSDDHMLDLPKELLENSIFNSIFHAGSHIDAIRILGHKTQTQ